VTARKRAEEGLRRSEATLAAAQRIAHLGSWAHDLRTGELVWSDEKYRILGFAPGAVTPTHEQLMAAVHPDDRARLERAVDAAAEVVGRPIALHIPPERPDELPGIMARLGRGERITQFETVRLCKDGRRVEVSVSIAPIRDRAGAVVGASTIARDITAQKRAE